MNDRDDEGARRILRAHGISITVTTGKSTGERQSWAAPYDPRIWDATRDLRMRMFGFGLEFACGSLREGDVALAESAFMRSRRWLDFRKGCVESGSPVLSRLSIYWASDLFTTAATLMNGHRRLLERARRILLDDYPNYKVWLGPQCNASPHAAVDGFIAPRTSRVWEWVRPPFDYACNCSVDLKSGAERTRTGAFIPESALTSHDWMPIFPAHLKLKRFSL